MKYVDGFVLVVPKNKVSEYKKIAQGAAKTWKKYGALEYFECMGDDLYPNMPGMKALTFPEMSKMKKGETVWFSFIIYKSRKHRDSVNKRVMSEISKEMEKGKNFDMPFDMKKMAFGGFKAMVGG